jgi:hypothetical protein
VSNRYERASMIVTSNKPFSAWGETFGDDMVTTAMMDPFRDPLPQVATATAEWALARPAAAVVRWLMGD